MIVLTHNYPSIENITAGIFVKDHADKISVESETIPQIVHLAYGEKMSFAIGKIPKLFKYIFISIGAIKRLNESEQDEIIVHWWIPLGWLAAWFFKGKVSVVCHGTDLLTCDGISFYDRTVPGNAPPLRTLSGPATRLNGLAGHPPNPANCRW